MNTTAISNLLRVLESREADGSASVTGAERSKAIEKLKAKLAEVTLTDENEVNQAHNYHIRALDMSNGTDKLITGADRASLVSSHVGVLTSQWSNADQQVSAILDAIVRNDSYAPEVKTFTGENRITLKTKLIELL